MRNHQLIGGLILGLIIAGSVAWGGNPAPVIAKAPAKATTVKAKPVINWRKPSQAKPYPNLKHYRHAWLYVSTKRQRVYVYNHKGAHQKVLYIMYCSTGTKKSPTPKGTYHIQAQRGYSFYNAASGEGARYWVSWKDHGVYLFHSVPVNRRGHYVKAEAAKLGRKPASHGCVRLSIADAQWVYHHVPYGMRVEIH